jgi:hypothetical protein
VSEPHAAAVALYADLTRNLITLCTAVIGFFAVTDKVFGTDFPARTWPFFLGLALFVGSTAAGLLVQGRLIVLAEQATPVAGDRTLKPLAQAQQLAFFFGLASLAAWLFAR